MSPILLVQQCAPQVAPVTMAAIVQQESGGNVLAIHDNTSNQNYRPNSLMAAVSLARKLIAEGHSVDLGLAQINSRNLSRLKLDAQQVFDPCANLRAAQTILLDGWKQASGDLRGALSAYNTGNVGGAVGAHYSAGVYAQAGVVVQSIPGGKLARWTSADESMFKLPPVRPVVTWTPEASPLAPKQGELSP